MIHGDLKGVRFQTLSAGLSSNMSSTKANILIDDSGRARIADFGLVTFISDPANTTAPSSTTNGGTTRWMSPELLHPEKFGFKDTQRTRESDCYALGMVVLEVLTGRSPFAGLSEIDVMQKVTGGKSPERPKDQWFTNDLWKTLKQCWSPRPKRRPAVEAVLDCLGRVSSALRLSSSSTTRTFGWIPMKGRVPR
jgi:serine/threonine protein kinase